MREPDINERISALADDEVGRDELRFMLRSMAHDPQLCDRYRRYVLIREALGRNLASGDVDLRAGVAAALDSDDSDYDEHAARSLAHSILKPVAGVAVAASVALAVVAVWPTFEAVETGTATVASGADAGQPEPAGSGGVQFASGGDRAASGEPARDASVTDPRMHRKLNGFLVNHSEHSASGQFGGVLSFSRIAGHDEAGE